MGHLGFKQLQNKQTQEEKEMKIEYVKRMQAERRKSLETQACEQELLMWKRYRGKEVMLM